VSRNQNLAETRDGRPTFQPARNARLRPLRELRLVLRAGSYTTPSDAAAISVATVGAGESAMMKQTSLDGLKLNLRPTMLAVSPSF
jgi:hypothetical protein